MSVFFKYLSILSLLLVVLIGNESYAVIHFDDPNDLTASKEVKHSNEEKWKFGDFRLRIGITAPKFKDEKKFYDKLYGAPKNEFQLSVDHYFWQKYAALGVGIKFGYYAANGFAAGSGVADPAVDQITIDRNEPTELTYIPIQLYGTVQFTPFPWKYVVIDGWMGYERGYLQEVRVNSGSKAEEESESGDDETSSKAAKVNLGKRSAATLGMSVNILLNYLDEQSVGSMTRTFKISSIYLSPFVEYITPVGEFKGFSIERTNLGIAFTFEGI